MLSPNSFGGTSTSSIPLRSGRLGGDPHLAQDVAQTVFSDLARKALALARRTNLSGWLYTSARFAAAKMSSARWKNCAACSRDAA